MGNVAYAGECTRRGDGVGCSGSSEVAALQLRPRVQLSE